MILPLRSPEPLPGVLSSALGPPAKQGHGHVRTSPEEGHENGKEAGAPLP